MNKSLRDKVVSRQNAQKHNRRKAHTLIGQLAIYYLPMGEWWWKLKRTLKAVLITSNTTIFFTSWFAKKDFSLNTKRKFTKTIDDNVKLRRRTRYSAKQFFLKEKNLQRKMYMCHSVSSLKQSSHSPAICEQN